jgi:hypothetical protein
MLGSGVASPLKNGIQGLGTNPLLKYGTPRANVCSIAKPRQRVWRRCHPERERGIQRELLLNNKCRLDSLDSQQPRSPFIHLGQTNTPHFRVTNDPGRISSRAETVGYAPADR